MLSEDDEQNLRDSFAAFSTPGGVDTLEPVVKNAALGFHWVNLELVDFTFV